jgi:type VI secretion system protein ImpF
MRDPKYVPDPRPVEGGRALLFERLADPDPPRPAEEARRPEERVFRGLVRSEMVGGEPFALPPESELRKARAPEAHALREMVAREGDGGGGRPFRAFDVRALKESVRRELWRLLNTRRHGRPWQADGRGEMTVLDYGLPDFSSLSAASGDDQNRVAAEVSAAITAFEPRLRDVRITVERLRLEDRALLLRLDARLVVGSVAEPVSFVLESARSGEAQVDED